MKAILIPVKDLSRAKQRLAPFLRRRERADLAWAMFVDTSEAVAGWYRKQDSGEVRVYVVTNSSEVATRGKRLGWRVLHEGLQNSESASIDWASQLLSERGADSVLRLPADIPLVQPGDIDELFKYSEGGKSALLVPSWDGLGTNALMRRPPDAFPSCFGPNSLLLHRQEAKRAGVPCQTVPIPRIALDVDEPPDLQRLLDNPAQTHTHRLLRNWCISERIASLEQV